MKNIFLLFIVALIIESCDKKTQKQIDAFVDKESLTLTISDSDLILIRPKKPNQTESTREDSCFDLALYKAEKHQILEFKKLFENSNYTEYCCCPETNMAINFYENSKKISTYFVDTIEFKNEVRIFEQSYQYSFLIKKQEWKDYLKKINAE